MQVKLIDKTLLDNTTQKARESERLRMNYNIHDDLKDPVNRLLNAMEPGTYIPPHRHTNPSKSESCIVLRGELDVLIFDDLGNVTEKYCLNPEKGFYGIDFGPNIWHCMIVKEPGTVIYEVKPGPFAPLSKEDIAPWAPEPTDNKNIELFFQKYAN